MGILNYTDNRILSEDYKNGIKKERNYKSIRTLFDLSQKTDTTLDEETFTDLNLEVLHSKIDRCYSSAGEASLYAILRNPFTDKESVEERSRVIDEINENSSLRLKLQNIFFELGKDSKGSFFEMITRGLKVNNAKYYIYLFLGRIMPIILIAFSILKDMRGMLALFVLFALNAIINNWESSHIKANGITYLCRVIRAGKKISRVKADSFSEDIEEISGLFEKLKSIDNGSKLMGFMNNAFGGILEFISVALLVEESTYYKLSNIVDKNKGDILRLYYKIGEIEALISVAGYRNAMGEKVSKPIFKDEMMLNVKEGYHPLLDNSVPNSIDFKKKGIVLTGTNMSGKSTFLRMLGCNMVLAQCFNFTLSKSYEACFFNIVSSISPNDDITKGKSYYMAEAESLLRIVNAVHGELPVFSAIDEIFRGTNPVERIAASSEILQYISKENSLSIVATHDRELTDRLKDSFEFYYFSEDVDNKNGLKFDYKIKKGVSQTRNAIKLLKHIGYPDSIIKAAYKTAETIEGYI